MTEIKSVYQWKVVLIDKSALEPNNTDIAVHMYMGEENTKLDCIDKMTRVVIEKCKNSEYVLDHANFEYIGEEL